MARFYSLQTIIVLLARLSLFMVSFSNIADKIYLVRQCDIEVLSRFFYGDL